MDDFLHNLRSGKLKQQDRGRRDYTDYKGPQRRAGSERRRTDYYTKVTNEHFMLIKSSLDKLAENQSQIAKSLARAEAADNRIADALESIATMIAGRLGGATQTASEPPITADHSATDETDRDETPESEMTQPVIGVPGTKLSETDKHVLLNKVTTMRSEGDSWEKIARHLIEQQVPTLSGKGKWRGVSVKKFWEANS